MVMGSLSFAAPLFPGAISVGVGTSQGNERLYLLAGTSTTNDVSGFPVQLYTTSSGRLGLVRKISSSLFSVTDDLDGRLYVLDIGFRTLNVIHENSPARVDVVSAPSGRGPTPHFEFYYPSWGAIRGPQGPPGIVFAYRTDHWTVMRILGDAVPGKPRIEEGNWDLYRYFQYEGPGGGPYRYIVPAGTIDDSRIMAPYTVAPGRGYLGPTPPFLSAQAGVVVGYSNRPRGADIVADTQRFFAFVAPLPTEPQWPRTVYVLNKATGRWAVIKVQFYYLWPRLFREWLSTTIAEPNPQGRESPGLKNERTNEVDKSSPTGIVRKLPRVRGMYPPRAFMPGKLTLENLVDGRSISIDTGQQDSEVLDVRSDGLVLYRVNDSIYSAHIEGNKLSAPTLVVKDKDVPEVHWAFWSNASSGTAASADKPSAKQ